MDENGRRVANPPYGLFSKERHVTQRAILSVYDKTGLLPLAQGLANLGWELVASGGTSRLLREGGLPVLDVAALTGAPKEEARSTPGCHELKPRVN